MRDDVEEIIQLIRNQRKDLRQLVAETTEKIIAAIDQHHAVRDRVEQKGRALEETVCHLGNRADTPESPAADGT